MYRAHPDASAVLHMLGQHSTRAPISAPAELISTTLPIYLPGTTNNTCASTTKSDRPLMASAGHTIPVQTWQLLHFHKLGCQRSSIRSVVPHLYQLDRVRIVREARAGRHMVYFSISVDVLQNEWGCVCSLEAIERTHDSKCE